MTISNALPLEVTCHVNRSRL